jgi:hypothetical protein
MISDGAAAARSTPHSTASAVTIVDTEREPSSALHRQIASYLTDKGLVGAGNSNGRCCWQECQTCPRWSPVKDLEVRWDCLQPPAAALLL